MRVAPAHNDGLIEAGSSNYAPQSLVTVNWRRRHSSLRMSTG